jgi:hypothetical protein
MKFCRLGEVEVEMYYEVGVGLQWRWHSEEM